MRVPMSPAAAALYQALVGLAKLPRDQVLLTGIRTIDWQSLTLTGERHEIGVRLIGADSHAAACALCDGLDDAEFAIPGLIVADIGLVGPPRPMADGSVEISLEALTIEE